MAAEKNVEYIKSSITDKYLRESLKAEATVDQKNTTVNARRYALPLFVIDLSFYSPTRLLFHLRGIRIKIDTSHNAWEMIPGHTERYLL